MLSELRKGAKASARVRAWFAGVAEDEIFLSVLVLGEVRRGIELIRARDSAQAAVLERWLARVSRSHADRVLPVDGRVAEQWGRLMAMRSGSVIDTLMAATALVHGMVLVTRNAKDVAWTGVSCLDPFRPGPTA